MFKPASHRILKNRTLKRRVTSHHYTPQNTTQAQNAQQQSSEFAILRTSQVALTKLKHKPELVKKLAGNLKNKQQSSPKDPHLKQWQRMLDALVAGKTNIDNITEKVMGYDEQAKQLRHSAVLECLLD